MKPRLNPYVFWPPFLLLLAAVILNLVNREWFSRTILGLNSALLSWFGWLFVAIAFACLGLCGWIAISRFGRVRLGGADAKPLMSLWNWFAISLCTTVAIGLLFWSTAEPLTHYYHPPASLGIAPQSAEAQNFALATLYLHWTFVPYSIYCVASILFAYAHYNLKLPFSLGSMLAPLLGTSRATRVGPVVDAVCLYSLVAGMAATLGTGILTISGGLESLWKIPRSGFVWGLITTAIVATFIASSATGLMRGIRILSDINTKGLLLLGLLVFLLGPTWLIIQHGCWAAVQYPWALWRTGLWEPVIGQDAWARQWSVFYWAVWMAWTPITACFLGRIAYGRTIHEFLLVNLLAPSLFCMVWMSVWATTTLHFEQAGAGLEAGRQIAGNESVSYAVLAALPGGTVMVTFYLLSAFVCFVTSADSNTTAMASISSRDVSLANPEGPTWVKIAWGILVGATAWIMVSFADVEGIRTLSNLGGFPAACLLVFVLLSLLKVSLSQSATDPEHPSPQGFAAAESRPPT